ncbi:cysteine and histidine-rich domain-containing protein 1-like isoform X1 [Ascaphus truei]|uniref:cysteine and histidine-rich domain-containing protein 1-like isoform X1 n=1 Tax=Ascaphus truei TaxID=8439 RepID=UPI003F5A3ACB
MSCPDVGISDTLCPLDVSALCYNKGCGQRFNPTNNSADSCLFHPGFPIFHDALKGWSCCKKRTTDFSEFLAIQGCSKGPHGDDKLIELFRPEVCGSKSSSDIVGSPLCPEIVQGPKSAEKMQKERPSAQEQKLPLTLRVSAMLEQVLDKLRLGPNPACGQKDEAQLAGIGTGCKHAGCKEIYRGPESDTGTCVYHPGVPVFHEGMKFWSCCAIKTSDFNTFLDQSGCRSGRHLWVQSEAVSCRYDWHQTSSLVVITIYAKTAMPESSQVLANRTRLDIQISFQGRREFRRQLELWGVIDVDRSFVSLLPAKVEITLWKSDSVTWGRLENPLSSSEDPLEGPQLTLEGPHESGAESDDDLSWSEDEDSSD